MSAMLRRSLASLLLVLPACAELRFGSPIALEKVQEVREGYTNRDRVSTLFGAPLRKVPSGDGEIWVYRHMDGGNVCQELVVTFTGDVVSTIVHD